MQTMQGPGSAAGFGAADITPAEENQLPQYTGIGQQIKNAEEDALASYTNLATLVTMVGDQAMIPRKVLVEYNRGVEMLKIAAADWINAQKKANQPAHPTYPPLFRDMSGQVLSGSGGALGAAAEVPASQIVVTYGPEGQERAMALGDPRAASLGLRGPGAEGLGNPLLVVIVFLGIGFVVLAVALLIREWKRAEVEANRARAREAEAHFKQVRVVTNNLVKLYTACIGNSTDNAHRIKCMDSAHKGVKAAIDALPKTKGPSLGRGFFGTLGLIVFTGGLVYGGYYLYKRNKMRKAGMAKTGRMADRRGRPPRTRRQ